MSTLGAVPVVEVVGGAVGALAGGIVWAGYVENVEGDCLTVVEPTELAIPEDVDALGVPDEPEAEPPETIGPGVGLPSGPQFEIYGVLAFGSTEIAMPDAVVLLKAEMYSPVLFGVDDPETFGPAGAVSPRAPELVCPADKAARPAEVCESPWFEVNPTVAAMIATIAVAVEPAPKNVSLRFLARTRAITFPSASSTSVEESELAEALWLGSNGFCDSSM